MPLWKLTLAYDGTAYYGWQIQPGLPTIQGTLSDALHRVASERVLPQGSGRTDAGVHALGQVASFTLEAPIPAPNLQRALNRVLPSSIRVLTAEHAPAGFHARHSALRKTYEYRIFPLHPTPNPGLPCHDPAPQASVPHPSQLDGWGVNTAPSPEGICPPTIAPYVWPCPWPLDLAALNQAARHILGSHDFTSFAALDPELAQRSESGSEPATAVRTIHGSTWHAANSESQAGLLVYRITGSGFLHHMVRNLVGTFVQAGAHRLDPGHIPAILAARTRSAAGPTAPAGGLFLVRVDYPEAIEYPASRFGLATAGSQRATNAEQRPAGSGSPATAS